MLSVLAVVVLVFAAFAYGVVLAAERRASKMPGTARAQMCEAAVLASAPQMRAADLQLVEEEGGRFRYTGSLRTEAGAGVLLQGQCRIAWGRAELL